jgi:Na+/H+-translocating membrane pyrophosphatase
MEDEIEGANTGLLLEIGSYIERGASAFLVAEYRYIAIFVLAMAFVIFFFVE